ncbi:hypothetical protein FRB93_005057 [Tulasnella sp. JGI-2019a]|nr:hypothetical protein FRB93_005057 [Tulasnella sp. JGI-2019a]
MARWAVCIFLYSKGGAPIREYLKDYGSPASTTTCDGSITPPATYCDGDGSTTPSTTCDGPITPSEAMLDEIEAWLNQETSPPAIFTTEKYNGMTAKDLYYEGRRYPRDGKRIKWGLQIFWVEVIEGFDSLALEAVVTCILSMKLDRLQVENILGFSALQGFPPEVDEIVPLIRVSEHEEWLDAFEPYGKLPEGQGLSKEIIDRVLGGKGGYYARHRGIENHEFTEDQMAELKEVIFLHSEPKECWWISYSSKQYLRLVKERFNKLTPEHKLHIRLLALLVNTPEGLEGLRNGITNGDVSYFT